VIAPLLIVVAVLTPAQKAARFKLQPGADGKVCFECHADFQQKLKKSFVHTPVKGGDCTSCHNPHASEHGKLLATDEKQICRTCHDDLVPKQAKSVHPPVAAGNCVGCHDPHASDNKFELSRAGVETCGSCHTGISDRWRQVRVKHAGAAGSCGACHEVHASAEAEHLLKGEEPALCLRCHKPDKSFAARHMGYPVQKAACTSCHDPHGSDKPGMLYNTVHKPLANRQCRECHAPPGSPASFATKVAGPALCKTCHAQQMAQMLDKPQVHWAVVDEKACLNCHNPHASRLRGLVRGNMRQTCGACHADTVARQDRSPTKHKPVQDGECTACHSPHSSEVALLMKRPDTVQICGTCHDWQKHSTHPIGDKLKDPRNRNLTMNCLSCHRAHGTEYQHMTPYPTTTELCTKCHVQFKR
jgi:predicted CXXCH cytochrome family protein